MERKIRPTMQERRDNKRAYIRRRRQKDLIRKVTAFVAIIACIIVGAICIKKFISSKERVDLKKYYGIKTENQLAVIVDNKVVDKYCLTWCGRGFGQLVVVGKHVYQRALSHVTPANEGIFGISSLWTLLYTSTGNKIFCGLYCHHFYYQL